MAKSNNILLKKLRGALGKQIVIKEYPDKIVVTAFLLMKKRKATPLQELYRNPFSEAVAYAKSIIYNPVKKAAYAKKVKLKPGQSIYQHALKTHLNKIKPKRS